MATTSVRNASFSADERRILYSSNETGIFNVYSVPAAGGAAAPVTRSTTDSTYAVAYFPADDRIHGVPVEYVVFPDEGHGFSKRKNTIEAYGRIREFLDKYLKGAPAASATGASPPAVP